MPSFDISTRAQVLALKAFGASYEQIEYHTGIGARTVRLICAKAEDGGFPINSPQPGKILDIYVENAPRTGRPKKKDNVKD